VDAPGSNEKVRPEDLILVGSVAGTHGLSGEIKLYPHSDDPSRLLGFQRLYLGSSPETAKEYRVARSGRFHRSKGKTFVVLSLQSVESIEAGKRLQGDRAFVPDADLPLDEDEFFLHDLIGWQVVGEDGSVLGDITGLRAMPASDMLLVELENGKQVMIPAIPEFVIDVDPENSKVVIKLLEGLLE
jgi:16S rRNA processing protein RimM